MPFRNREEAGEQLARALRAFASTDPVVIGLPRGGVAVARPVAERLGATFDVLVARKLGAPNQPEFAIGAVTARGTRVLNDAVLRRMFLPPGYLEAETRRQRALAEERERDLRGVRRPVPLHGRTVILVDDGIATGMTMRAAIADVRDQGPSRLVVAAPVAAPDTYFEMQGLADTVVALELPPEFAAVGQFYGEFEQVSDDAVRRLLAAPV